jgi:hypothetical protein
MCCNNKRALMLSSHHKGRIRPSAKCTDIRRNFHATKQTYQGGFKYVHVYGHMDQHLSWMQLSLTQQLSCICNTLAKRAATTAIVAGYHGGLTQILSREDLPLIFGVTRSQATSLAHYVSMQTSQPPANTTHTSERKADGHMSNSRRLIGSILILHLNPRRTTTRYGDPSRHRVSAESECKLDSTQGKHIQMSNAPTVEPEKHTPI